MDTEETYNYLREHYSNADPRALEQVTSLYQCANDLDNGYRRVLNLLITAYQVGYSQAQLDELTGFNAGLKELQDSNEELDTLLTEGARSYGA